MVSDISSKIEILKALSGGKNLNQLKQDFPKLTELDIKTILKQLKDDGLVKILDPPHDAINTGKALIDNVYVLTSSFEDAQKELFKRGIESKEKGTLRRWEPKKKN